MRHGPARLLIAAVISVMLVGCGGGGLIGALLGIISVGSIVTEIENLVGDENPDEFDVYVDGQLIPEHPNSNGRLRLQGLPEGRHLLQIVAPNHFRGAVTVINVQPNSDLRLDDLQAEVGGRLRGTVTLQEGQSGRSASRVLVYAVPGGAQVVRDGSGAVDLPPAGTHYAAFTDGNGEFSLDALAPGDYLVTAAVPGFAADVQLVAGLTERQTVTADLELEASGDAAGTLRGTVNGSIGSGATQSLPGAGVRAALDAHFQPDVPQAVRDEIATESGLSLMASPWFSCGELATLSDAGGSYEADLPPGTHRVSAFAYDYQPGYRDLTVTSDGVTSATFTLDAR